MDKLCLGTIWVVPFMIPSIYLFSCYQLKKHQQRIVMVLASKKIAYEEVDIASSEEAKNKMREIAQDPKALPPQIANGDQYCGVRS